MSNHAFRGFIWWIPAGWAFSEAILSLHVIRDTSNTPTLRKGNSLFSSDVALVDRISPRLMKYHRGELVLLHDPSTPGKSVVRRIVALENDYVSTSWHGIKTTKRVAKGSAWLETDNPEYSDSTANRKSVPLSLIQGRLTNIVWPPERWGVLKPAFPHGKSFSSSLT